MSVLLVVIAARLTIVAVTPIPVTPVTLALASSVTNREETIGLTPRPAAVLGCRNLILLNSPVINYAIRCASVSVTQPLTAPGGT